jgi:general stress protein CsbA
VFFAFVRYRLRDIPLERDEGEFAYGGQLIQQGQQLYKHLYTLKMPGTYAAYAVLLGLFGQTQAGLHLGLILVNAATTVLVFLLGVRFFGQLAGVVAAASYALLSTSPSVLGFAAHATHFVILGAIAGVVLLLDALETDKSWQFFCSGVLLGLAFQMKQPGILFLVWAGLYLLWQGRANRWKGLPRQMTALLSGSLLTFVATCLLMWRSGSFRDFWFWTFSYARQYGTNASLAYGFERLQQKGAVVIGSAVGVWLIAALGLTAFLWNRRARRGMFFAISFLACSFLAVSAGLYFREHYFILMLPAVSLLAGMAVACATETLLTKTRSRALGALPILIFVVAVSSAIYRQRDFLFRLDPSEASRQVYGDNPFPEAIEISHYIDSNTTPGATVGILGSEPEIFFYSHRHSATGHVCTYPILVPKYGVALQKQMEEEIEQASPEVLMLVNDKASWVAFPNTASMDEIMSWLQEYSREHYVVDGVAELDQYGTTYYWGKRAENHPVAATRSIIIMKRKPS